MQLLIGRDINCSIMHMCQKYQKSKLVLDCMMKGKKICEKVVSDIKYNLSKSWQMSRKSWVFQKKKSRESC